MQPRSKSLSYILMSALAVLTGLYPAVYFILDPRFGLLSTKTDALLASTLYTIAFYSHIVPGGIALLAGWSQFNSTFRNRHLQTHRTLGKIYVTCVLVSGTMGLCIAMHATGGWPSVAAFSILAVLWLYTTSMAYRYIIRGDQRRHEIAMIFSYALCFAAVTLRIWLFILIGITGDYFTAYPIAAWLCWVPNLLFAYFITRKMQRALAT